MGDFAKPGIEQVNTNPEFVRPLQGDAASFLQALFANPTGAGNPFAQTLGRSPEQEAFESLRSGLLGLAEGGGLGAGQQVVDAAQPVFDRNLGASLAALTSTAPSRFSTAFEGAGIDLSSRALQDFNLFAQQALQQGQQTGLGAAQLLGSLARGAGSAQTERFVNPTLQLLLGGLGFAQPQGNDTVVSPSGLDRTIDFGKMAALLAASYAATVATGGAAAPAAAAATAAAASR